MFDFLDFLLSSFLFAIRLALLVVLWNRFLIFSSCFSPSVRLDPFKYFLLDLFLFLFLFKFENCRSFPSRSWNPRSFLEGVAVAMSFVVTFLVKQHEVAAKTSVLAHCRKLR